MPRRGAILRPRKPPIVELLAIDGLRAFPDIDLSPGGFGEDDLKRFLKRVESEAKRYQPGAFDLGAALANDDDPLREPLHVVSRVERPLHHVTGGRTPCR